MKHEINGKIYEIEGGGGLYMVKHNNRRISKQTQKTTTEAKAWAEVHYKQKYGNKKKMSGRSETKTTARKEKNAGRRIERAAAKAADPEAKKAAPKDDKIPTTRIEKSIEVRDKRIDTAASEKKILKEKLADIKKKNSIVTIR